MRKRPVKKGKRFVLVQTAERASLVEDPLKKGSYRLILSEVDPYIQFYKAQPSKSFGILFMRQYVWYCKLGRSAFLRSKRGALGYVSFASSSKESFSKPAVLELVQPKYIKKENRLIYDVAAVDSFEIEQNDMEKVTLVIDLALN